MPHILLLPHIHLPRRQEMVKAHIMDLQAGINLHRMSCLNALHFLRSLLHYTTTLWRKGLREIP
jgi:hypothetical protein